MVRQRGSYYLLGDFSVNLLFTILADSEDYELVYVEDPEDDFY